MKLFVITAVRAFKKKVKKVLAESKVLTYSYVPVTGYRDSTEDALSSNWFGTEMNKVDSILFFAFVSEEVSETVFNSIETINKDCDINSRVHINVMPIEKYNSINSYQR